MAAVAVFMIVAASIAQAYMLVAFVVWVAGLMNAVSYGLMSRATIPVCAAILTAVGYLFVR